MKKLFSLVALVLVFSSFSETDVCIQDFSNFNKEFREIKNQEDTIYDDCFEIADGAETAAGGNNDNVWWYVYEYCMIVNQY